MNGCGFHSMKTFGNLKRSITAASLRDTMATMLNVVRSSRFVLGLACFCLVPLRVLADGNATELGQRYTAEFFNGQHDLIWQQMTDDMRKTMGSKEAIAEFQRRVEAGAGIEQRIIRETVRRQAGSETYLRYSIFDRSPGPVVVSWSFESNGQISGFDIRPERQPAMSPHLDYQTRAHLRLPFDGEWFVFWGGRDIEQNYHASAKDQRFAYDFVITRDGASHSGDGTREADYFCWGRPVLSPAKAKVVSVERLLADNPPGITDATNPVGNHVILDLGNDEYALLAHLKANSITVEQGDDLAPGQAIGECGNSGNTSEPHLHFHLQDQPEFGEGFGLPAFFHDYSADGKYVTRGEPVQGQTVAPAR